VHVCAESELVMRRNRNADAIFRVALWWAESAAKYVTMCSKKYWKGVHTHRLHDTDRSGSQVQKVLPLSAAAAAPHFSATTGCGEAQAEGKERG
jgi:uncharacterized protein with PIN domain